MDIKIVNPIDFDNWDNLILSNPDYSFFHSSYWAKVLAETYNYVPEYVLLGDHSNIISIVPLMNISSLLTGNRGVSLPFTDYCDPLLYQKINFKELLNELILYSKKKEWKYFELRGSVGMEENKYSKTFFLHNLNLNEDTENIYSKFRESTKRNIKTAYKNNLKVIIDYSHESMDVFYDLNCLTRKRHGLPPQPKKFFNNIYKYIISQKKGFIILASINNLNIAGSVYFHFGKKAIYKYGASIPEYNALKANNIVMWEAIKWYCINKFKYFSFGITDIYNNGLIQFKDGWGTEKKIFGYIKYNLNKDKFVTDSGELNPCYTKIFNKLPVPVLKLIGKYVYKHIG